MNFQKLEEIENVGSSIIKMDLLNEFIRSNNGAEVFLRMAVDKNLLIGLKETNMFNAFNHDNNGEMKYEDIGIFLEQLKLDISYEYQELDISHIQKIMRDLVETSGNEQLQLFHDLMIKLKPIDRKWVSRMLKHDLNMGVSLKTVNRVFEDIGLTPIFKYQVQLAGSFDNWRDEKEFNKRITFPIFVEKKYDGFRLELRKTRNEVILMSRRGKIIEYAPEINEIAKQIFNEFDEITLDGELVGLNEEGGINFNEIQKRSLRKLENQEPMQICMILYDIISIDGMNLESLDQASRKTRLIRLFLQLGNITSYSYTHPNGWTNVLKNPFIISDHTLIFDKEKINELYLKALEEGFEGLILKDPNATYDRGSRKNWWKIKKSSKDNLCDATLKIIDIKFGTGKNKDVVSSILVTDSTNMVQSWASNMEEAQMEECTNKHSEGSLIGSLCDVSYMEISKINDPWRLRHPVFERFRPDKDIADDLLIK